MPATVLTGFLCDAHGRVGEARSFGTAPQEVAKALEALASRGDSWEGGWLACREGTLEDGDVSPEIRDLLGRPVDIWHGGLRCGLAGQPRLLEFVRPAWMLAADADPTIESSSWRISLRSMLIRTETFRRLGGVWPRYSSVEAMGLDLGFRAITAGGIVRYSPVIAPAAVSPPVTLTLEDELRLVMRNVDRRWALWALWRAWRRGRVTLRACLKAVVRGHEKPLSPPTVSISRVAATSAGGGKEVGNERVSVLIPTLERYPYLEKLLGQLERQTVAPHQVIVVDQTPVELRREDMPRYFARLPLVWITRDQAGQSSARNAGLERVTGDWVLFLDDDVEVPPTFIARHLATALSFGADAVSGTVRGLSASVSPSLPSFPTISTVFPAGTSLVKTEALRRSGWFDEVYDRGQRADADVGMRLYLAGTFMVFDPDNCILHHHAPRGGLRTHGRRVVTRAAARQSLIKFSFPSPWDFYYAYRYFGPEAAREVAALAVLGSFSTSGSLLRRALRALWALLLLPRTLQKVREASRAGERLYQQGPQYPILPGQTRRVVRQKESQAGNSGQGRPAVVGEGGHGRP